MELIATYRPADDTTAEPRRVTFTGGDYVELFAQARAATGDGERLIHVMVERP